MNDATSVEEKRDSRSRALRACAYLGMGLRTWEIVQALRNQYHISPSVARKSLAAGRRMLVEELSRPKVEHLAEALEFYRITLRNQQTTKADKFRAQAEIIKLVSQLDALGRPSEPPRRPDVLDIDFQRLSDDELRVFCKVLEEYALPRKKTE